MSSLPTALAGNDYYQYNSSETDLLNGFVAGIAGSSLQDNSINQGDNTFKTKRTLRLSAKSSSFEDYHEIEYRQSETSITEEHEMRISEGSEYPSQFSLLNFSNELGKDVDSEQTVSTNCSTIDVFQEPSMLSGDEHRRSDEPPCTLPQLNKDFSLEDDSVFSSRKTSFGDVQQDEIRTRGDSSTSSFESFGDFDDCRTSTSILNSTEVEVEIINKTPSVLDIVQFVAVKEDCYNNKLASTEIRHSSPKEILDQNFVWTQARKNVTKPSYTWQSLKLHSCLLGALGVRKPISLNRLKPSVCERAQKVHRHTVTKQCTESVATESVTTESVTAESVTTEISTESVIDTPQGGDSDRSDWNDSNTNISNIEQCCKPCVPSVLQRKLQSHRRVNSSPATIFTNISGSVCSIPNIPTETRSLTGSPGVFKQIQKSNSVENRPSPPSPMFDESHAGRALFQLDLEDIQTMHKEMKVRVSELSATLITEFLYRGDADHSKEVKKAFSGALVLAEEKKSRGQISSKQMNLLPIPYYDPCPSTEILVLLTQLLNGVVEDTSHTADLLKHYLHMLTRSK